MNSPFDFKRHLKRIHDQNELKKYCSKGALDMFKFQMKLLGEDVPEDLLREGVITAAVQGHYKLVKHILEKYPEKMDKEAVDVTISCAPSKKIGDRIEIMFPWWHHKEEGFYDLEMTRALLDSGIHLDLIRGILEPLLKHKSKKNASQKS